MDWSVFIFALLDWLKECMEERRRDQVEHGLNNPGFRERRVATKLLRDQDLHGRELRHEVDQAMAYLAEQDAEDISCLLDDAEARPRVPGASILGNTITGYNPNPPRAPGN